jgi:hypothetical protein
LIDHGREGSPHAGCDITAVPRGSAGDQQCGTGSGERRLRGVRHRPRSARYSARRFVWSGSTSHARSL